MRMKWKQRVRAYHAGVSVVSVKWNCVPPNSCERLKTMFSTSSCDTGLVISVLLSGCTWSVDTRLSLSHSGCCPLPVWLSLLFLDTAKSRSRFMSQHIPVSFINAVLMTPPPHGAIITWKGWSVEDDAAVSQPEGESCSSGCQQLFLYLLRGGSRASRLRPRRASCFSALWTPCRDLANLTDVQKM